MFFIARRALVSIFQSVIGSLDRIDLHLLPTTAPRMPITYTLQEIIVVK